MTTNELKELKEDLEAAKRILFDNDMTTATCVRCGESYLGSWRDEIELCYTCRRTEVAND
jgi:hypothetical protein